MNDSKERIIVCHNDLLEFINPDELPAYLQEHTQKLLINSRPFARFMRAKIKTKRILQQNVFLAADISENYGYKLIAEEKHTVARDTILRICIAAQFNLKETQEALIIYGMAPLYSKFPRDIVFIIAIENKIYDIFQVNELLIKCNQLPLINDAE